MKQSFLQLAFFSGTSAKNVDIMLVTWAPADFHCNANIYNSTTTNKSDIL